MAKRNRTWEPRPTTPTDPYEGPKTAIPEGGQPKSAKRRVRLRQRKGTYTVVKNGVATTYKDGVAVRSISVNPGAGVVSQAPKGSKDKTAPLATSTKPKIPDPNVIGPGQSITIPGTNRLMPTIPKRNKPKRKPKK